MRRVKGEWPFEIVAAVVLPDHLHWIWTLPEGDADFSRRMGRIKAMFTKAVGDIAALPSGNLSRGRHRESEVWQRRFWEHAIRDEKDLENHLNYIHYNPVKHGLVKCPHDWRASSFRKWVSNDGYAMDWCCVCEDVRVRVPYPEGMEVGE